MLRNLSIGLVLALGLAACGSAQVISRTQTGGVIQLNGDRGKAMEQATQEMAAHCGPGNYAIVQEGQEVVGQDTFVREDTEYGEDTSRSGRSTRGGQTTQAQQSTRAATEWRVHYQCGGAAGGPPPGPPGYPQGGPPPPAPPPVPPGQTGY